MKQWRNAKRTAYAMQWGCCQICRIRYGFKEMVGHHKRNRCQGGTNGPENCAMRCIRCEEWAHSVDTYGNPSPITLDSYRYNIRLSRRRAYA